MTKMKVKIFYQGKKIITVKMNVNICKNNFTLKSKE